MLMKELKYKLFPGYKWNSVTRRPCTKSRQGSQWHPPNNTQCTRTHKAKPYLNYPSRFWMRLRDFCLLNWTEFELKHKTEGFLQLRSIEFYCRIYFLFVVLFAEQICVVLGCVIKWNSFWYWSPLLHNTRINC